MEDGLREQCATYCALVPCVCVFCCVRASAYSTTLLLGVFAGFASQGGHDSKFRDNIVYHGTGSFHGGNDGQNCVNAWPMVPGHGCEWTGNKCVLPRSNNLFGLIAGGCDCPGPAFPTKRFNASDPGGPGPQKECGVKFGHNEYFTHNGSATANQCGDFDTEWKDKNEPDSTIASLPTDEQLLEWAKEKLDMK